LAGQDGEREGVCDEHPGEVITKVRGLISGQSHVSQAVQDSE
jgi:hypothetical protein